MTPDDVIGRLRRRGWTIATGESLTAGRVVATLADVAGCSDVLRGGVVAYQADIKVGLLGVPVEAASAGVVSQEVAEAMARGAAMALRADVGVATTGVAGPEPHAGEPVGSVWIAVCTPDMMSSRHLTLSGDREAIRSQTVAACLEQIAATLGNT